jgi:hypothetical protein
MDGSDARADTLMVMLWAPHRTRARQFLDSLAMFWGLSGAVLLVAMLRRELNWLPVGMFAVAMAACLYANVIALGHSPARSDSGSNALPGRASSRMHLPPAGGMCPPSSLPRGSPWCAGLVLHHLCHRYALRPIWSPPNAGSRAPTPARTG